MTAETSNARGDLQAVLQEMRERQVARRFKSQTLINWADRIECATATSPPPAAARGDVRGLVSLATRVQYADTHAQVANDDAGEFICLPPWLWLEIRDAAAEALAAEGEICETDLRGAAVTQAGEVEQRARELLAAECVDLPAVADVILHANYDTLPFLQQASLRAIVVALEQESNDACL